MAKYRIIKQTTEKTNKVIYYLEVKRKFLKWKWWARKTFYHAGYDITFDMSYDTYEEAKKELSIVCNA